eukprot:CAMPEP_0168514642 /NCGR_PEP_ID=MMETSP0405-20121227/4243_1 /TAXON_ID=498012 /ORGANISM="Trichosphaerium sp, Strain Am-I-7 wt" /LENGTH=157 /DNA_ID=CAMNT_0008533831 /DNA_START=385 /DNA_END=855 /DNA_ORIENTATION=+
MTPFRAVKIIVVGSQGSGKSTLVKKLCCKCGGKRADEIPTSELVHFGTAIRATNLALSCMEIERRMIKLHLWGPLRSEREEYGYPSQYKGVHACIITCEVNSKRSWRQVKQWINHVYDNVTEDVVVVLALLGLEKKKERVIKGSKIKVFCEDYKIMA